MNDLVLHRENGEELKKISLEKKLISGPVRRGLLYYAVNAFLASKRTGTHSVKTRGQVSGSTKKIYRQKGTGRARHGSKKVPTFRGGGVAFGPSPRDYGYRLPKAARRSALQSVFALKFKENAFKLVEDLNWEKPSTKKASDFFKSLGVKSAVLVAENDNINIRLSIRNLPFCSLQTVEELNVYDLLNHEFLLVTESALNKIYQKLHLV